MAIVTRNISGIVIDSNGTPLAGQVIRLTPTSPYGSNGTFVGTNTESVTANYGMLKIKAFGGNWITVS